MRHKRALALLFLALTVLLLASQAIATEPSARWFWQNPIPTGSDLYDLAFEPGGQVGWAVGAAGTLVRSDSQGAIWSIATSPVPYEQTIHAVTCPSEGQVWLATSDGLYRTTNAGVTWAQSASGTVVRSIRFADALTGWYGTEDGRIFRTENGGTTWRACGVPSEPFDAGSPPSVTQIAVDGAYLVATVGWDLWTSTDQGDHWTKTFDGAKGPMRVAFTSAQVAVAVDGWGFTRSVDGGRTWSARSQIIGGEVPVEARFTALWFASSSTGYAITDYGNIYRTLDSGLTWSLYQASVLNRYGEPSAGLPKVSSCVKSGSRWLMCGDSGTVVFTDDSGATYQNVTSEFTDSIGAVAFESELMGIAVGDNAALMTSDGGATWSRTGLGLTFRGKGIGLANGAGWVAGTDSVYSLPEILRVQRTGSTYDLSPQALPAGLGGWLEDVWTNDGVTAWATGPLWVPSVDGIPRILKTTNGGLSWSVITVPNAPTNSLGYAGDLMRVRVYPSGRGWAAGLGLMRTVDGGLTWTDITSNVPIPFGAVGMVDDRTCVVAGIASWGRDNAVAVTSDGGATWSNKPFLMPKSEVYVRDVYVVDANRFTLLMGDHQASYLMSTSDGGGTWSQSPALGSQLLKLAGSGGSVWGAGDGGALLFNGGSAGDFVPPSVRANAPTGWAATSAMVYLAGVDQCGIESIEWRFEDVPGATSQVKPTGEPASEYAPYCGPIRVSKEGLSRIRTYSTDVNGNVGVASTVDVRVDKSAPVTVLSIEGQHTMTPSISLQASDAGAGVRATYQSLDGGAARLYGGPFSVPRTGWHRLECWSTDYAGRTEPKRVTEWAQDGRAFHTAIAGTDRFATAVQMSQRAFPDGAPAAVIATGRNWPDALGGASLAGALDGPILLTDTASVPSVVMDELRRLGVGRVVILGGTKAVTSQVEAMLVEEFGRSAVSRIGGATRYETADAIATMATQVLGDDWDGTFFVATGSNFPDALAASPLASGRGWPLFLSQEAGLGTATKSKIAALEGSHGIILGGPTAVSGAVETGLAALGVSRVERLAGKNRYETAVAVAQCGIDDAGLTWDGVALATGLNFPDALAGGVAQGVAGSPVLLTHPTALSDATRACLVEHRSSITDVTYLGGQAAISPSVRSAVGGVLR